MTAVRFLRSSLFTGEKVHVTAIKEGLQTPTIEPAGAAIRSAERGVSQDASMPMPK